MLKAHLDRIFSHQVKRVVVGYSGGVDSHVLLHQLWKASKSVAGSPSICALHVNHGLSENAGQWQQHCYAVCKAMNVDFYPFEVTVDPEGSLEENARAARYQLFDTFLTKSDLILLAHHQDDQIETALFRLFRGLGFKGMPIERKLRNSRLFRPLLEVPREEIRNYARDQNLVWIEDETNEDTSFDRNYIRLMLLPMIHERWPHIRANLMHTLEREREMASLLDLCAEEDLVKADGDRTTLSLPGFRNLELQRKRNLLRYWISQSGYPLPSAGFISEAVRQMSSSDSFGLHWDTYQIRGYRHKAYLMNWNEWADHGSFSTPSTLSTLESFADQFPGAFSLARDKGQGIKAIYKQELGVGFRQGGEKIVLFHGCGSKKLKNLFQEAGIPPWIRDKIPLIFRNRELVAIPAVPEWELVGVVAKDMKAEGEEEGLVMSWNAGEYQSR